MREARQLRAAARAATRSAARRPTPAINDLWLQERGHLLPVRRHVHVRQRRRHRRLRGADAPPRLPARARHHRDLADAVPELARARYVWLDKKPPNANTGMV